MAWLGAILLATGSALGRLVSVHLLPTGILAFVVWFVIRVNAFGSGIALQWRDLLVDFRVDTAGVVLFIALLFALTVVLQPFEVAAVRLLEGYWGDGRLGRGAARFPLWWHRYRKTSADQAVKRENEWRRQRRKTNHADVESQAKVLLDGAQIRRRAASAKRLLGRYPPAAADVMPTLLGNVLRSAERRAGERYHLPTSESLTRLYQHLSERLSAAYNSSVDAVDSAAMMAIATGISAVVTLVAFIDDGASLLILPISFAGLSLLSYRGALVAAAHYGFYMDIAYDLHRFDLYRALHLDLPRTAAEERETAERLGRFWSTSNASAAQFAWRNVRYWHYDTVVRPAEVSESSDGEASKRSGYL